jgi:hypothetical protein
VQQERRPPLRHCRIDHSIAPETLDIRPSPYTDPCICFDYRSIGAVRWYRQSVEYMGNSKVGPATHEPG